MAHSKKIIYNVTTYMKIPDISSSYGGRSFSRGEMHGSVYLTPEEKLSGKVRSLVEPIYKELCQKVTTIAQAGDYQRPSLIRHPFAYMAGDRLVALDLDNSLANHGEVTYRPPSYGDQVDVRAITGQFGPSDTATLIFDTYKFPLLKKVEVSHLAGTSFEMKNFLADVVNMRSDSIQLIIDALNHAIDITTPGGKAFFRYSSQGNRLFGGWAQDAQAKNPLKESISTKNYLSIVKSAVTAQHFFG